MARAGLGLAILLAGCGLLSKDYDIEQPFQAGGLPSFTGSFTSTQLLGPLSADVSKISSVTLKAARIEATEATSRSSRAPSSASRRPSCRPR
jgi:hypothetical protein